MRGIERSVEVTQQVSAALAVSVMMGAAAQAATITDTTAISNFTPALGADVLTSQFDPVLGTLLSASVSLTGQLTPQVAFQNGSPNLSSVQFSPQVGILTVTPSGSTVFPIVAIQSLGTETVPVGTSTTLAGTPETVGITAALPVTGTPLSLAGSGSLDFHIEGSSGLAPSVVPLGGSLIDPYTDLAALVGQVAVTYTYTPAGGSGGAVVPEPASLALLGAGLLGLTPFRRRQRETSSARRHLPKA